VIVENKAGAGGRIANDAVKAAVPDGSTLLLTPVATIREPLLLQVLGGFSCAEIGAILSTSEGALMQRVSRARAALREIASGAARHPARQRT
jgi:RNA polymerase sigma-70 factor (ECF subfamily)